MPVIAGRTRVQMRQSVGYNLLGPDFIVSTTTRAGGDAESVIDRNRLFGGDTVHVGKWIAATSGSNDGEIRRCSTFTQGTVGTDAAGSHDMTVLPGFGATVPSGMGYELWDVRFRPEMVNDVILQTILSTYGRAYDLVVDSTLHTGGGISRFAIPSTLAAIASVDVRTQIEQEDVHLCERVFDQATDANITQVVDTEDAQRSNSLRLQIAVATDAGDFIADGFLSIDISDKTHIEGWVKCTTTLAAGDWILGLDDGNIVAGGGDLENLNVPAVPTADVWQYFQIALANPESDTAIISIGLEHNVDAAAAYFIWFDGIVATNQNTGTWERLSRRGWSIDRTANELVLTTTARADIGYALLRLNGGDEPNLTATDSTVMEVNEWWVICATTAQLFAAAHARHGGDTYQRSAALWEAKAREARKGLGRLRNARKV